MAQYTVREGESLIDVCYNACGSLSVLYQIMTLNSLDTFTPQLQAGQTLQIPETRNNDGVLVANKRPFNSNLIPQDTLDEMLNGISNPVSIIINVAETIKGSWSVDGGAETELHGGVNKIVVSHDFALLDITITESLYGTMLIRGEQGDVLQYSEDTYTIANDKYLSASYTLADPIPLEDDLVLNMTAQSGQGEIAFTGNTYPDEAEVFADYYNDTGAKTCTIAATTQMLVIDGYDERGSEVYTPTVRTSAGDVFKGQDGFTSIPTEKLTGVTIEII